MKAILLFCCTLLLAGHLPAGACLPRATAPTMTAGTKARPATGGVLLPAAQLLARDAEEDEEEAPDAPACLRPGGSFALTALPCRLAAHLNPVSFCRPAASFAGIPRYIGWRRLRL